MSGGKRGSATGGGRTVKQHVRTARKRSHSSTLWLERQLNDPYVQRAKATGWRSRAAFKLIEIDDRYRLLRPGQRIVDLGCAPGGWAQVAAERIGATAGRGRVIGIDLLEVEPIAGVDLEVLDFLAEDAPTQLKALLAHGTGASEALADGVMSDMAANATGHRPTDHLRIVALAELAAAFAREVLGPGGFFLAKVLQGGTESQLLADLKRDFAQVRHVKPAASRADSAELYVLATGFRGRSEAA